MSRVADNFLRVRDRVERAAERAGRRAEEVRVCAVSKRSELPEIAEAVAAGARVLGESRVQHAEAKIAGSPDWDVEWHLIGHLQRNKARKAVELFDVVQSVDSLTLARRLSDLGKERGSLCRVFVEVNCSGEEAKTGLTLESAVDELAEIGTLEGLELQGLMTMAPFTDDEGELRSCFRRLVSLRESTGGAARWPELSMGMTNDYEIAVEEGSTLVRVGTGIFG